MTNRAATFLRCLRERQHDQNVQVLVQRASRHQPRMLRGNQLLMLYVLWHGSHLQQLRSFQLCDLQSLHQHRDLQMQAPFHGLTHGFHP